MSQITVTMSEDDFIKYKQWKDAPFTAPIEKIQEYEQKWKLEIVDDLQFQLNKDYKQQNENLMNSNNQLMDYANSLIDLYNSKTWFRKKLIKIRKGLFPGSFIVEDIR